MGTTEIKIKEQPCLVEAAFKRAKERGEVNPAIAISCPCPKCRVRC